MTRYSVEFRKFTPGRHYANVRECYTPGVVGKMMKRRPSMNRMEFIGHRGLWCNLTGGARAGFFMSLWLDYRLKRHLEDPRTKLLSIFSDND